MKFRILHALLISLACLSLSMACQKRGEGLLKDPGEAGKKTVEGIDSDKDGVRDDLQVWIESEFRKSELIQMAVKEMARTHPASCDFKYKTGCLELLVGFDEALRVELELMERVLNTPARQKDFENKLEPCHSSEEMNQQKCPFDISEFKN